MDVTFPPLEALFTDKRPEGPGSDTITLTSFTIELDRAIFFGCSIDGQRSAEGETEMSYKFGELLPGEWEFRQFLTARPTGDADPATTAELRARAAKSFPEQKKSWWSRLFGG